MIWTTISFKKKLFFIIITIKRACFRTKSQGMTLCAGTACPCVVRTIKIPLLWRAIKNLSWTPRDTTSLNYPMHYLCTVVEIGFEGVQKIFREKQLLKKDFYLLCFLNKFRFRHFSKGRVSRV